MAKQLGQQCVRWGDHSRRLCWQLIEDCGDGSYFAVLCLTHAWCYGQTGQVSRERHSIQHLKRMFSCFKIASVILKKDPVALILVSKYVHGLYLLLLASQASGVVQEHDFMWLQSSGNGCCNLCLIQDDWTASHVPPHWTDQWDHPTVQTPLKKTGYHSNVGSFAEKQQIQKTGRLGKKCLLFYAGTLKL